MWLNFAEAPLILLYQSSFFYVKKRQFIYDQGRKFFGNLLMVIKTFGSHVADSAALISKSH